MASDGSIRISVDVDGKQVDVASKSLDNLEASGHSAGQGVKETEDGLKGAGEESQKASGNIKKFATALGLVAVGAAAFQVLRASMDDAIARFDTLNNFPKVLQALGVSAEDSEQAMTKLSDGIDGLPTKLDEISSTAQRMYTSFGDMDTATDSALALNNALLGSGASADQAQRGTEQYLKALQTGKMEMDTWNSLSETMDVGLVKIAEGFGFAGQSAKNDLYAALQDGSITMTDFNDKLIEVGTGTGIMAELAKENSMGIATSLSNLRNAAARGIADIIERFDNLSQAVTGNSIAENIDGMKNIVNAAFGAIGNAIDATTPIVKVFAGVIGELLPIVKPLTPALVGLATAAAGLMIVRGLGAAMMSFRTAVMGVTVVQKAATVATAASALAYNTLTGRVVAARVAQTAFGAATAALRTTMLAMTGPVGWVTLGIGALAGAVIGVVKWFNRGSEEGERLKEEVEQMSEETDSLTDSVDSNADAYREQVSDIEANRSANNDLLKTLDDLSSKENKSDEDKQKLKNTVDQLNGSVEGLNLMYNEEADRLSESSDEIQDRINLMSDLEAGQAAQERYSEILRDQQKAEEQLNDVLEQQNEIEENSSLTRSERKDMTEDLTEQEEVLRAKLEELGNEQTTTEETMVAAQEAIKQAVQDGNAAMILSYDALSEAQESAFEQMKEKYNELRDAATDAFERISDESEVSANEMIENLEHNQEMVAAWGENHGELMEWASKNGHDGFMQWLDTLGIDSAAELQTVADMSEEQLEEFAILMGEGGEVAANSMKDSLGEGLGEVGDILISMVNDGAMTTAEAIEAANFYELFGVLPNDAAQGIEDGTPEVTSSAMDLIDWASGATDEAINEAGFTEKGARMPNETAEGMRSGESQIRGSSVDLINWASGSTNEAISAAGFDSMGASIATGLQSGINGNSDSVATASRGLALTAADAFMSQAEINSPSRVFRRLGVFLTEGIVGGLNDGESSIFSAVTNMFSNMLQRSNDGMNNLNDDHQRGIDAIGRRLNTMPNIARSAMNSMTSRLNSGASTNVRVMRNLSNNMLSPFNNTRSQLSSIGSSAMSGLRAGLNGGIGRVMSTARSIASSVASTMRSALRINSPSRVMRDDVGRWIPEGLADGIERNMGSVNNAINAMNNMIIPSSPEMALGTHRMAYSGGYEAVNRSSRMDNTPKTPIQQVEQVIKVEASDVYMDGHKVGQITWKPVKDNIDRNNNRGRKRPRNGGAFA